MARVRLYLDEHISNSIAVGLRYRGVDVLTTPEAGKSGLDDEGQLRFAAADGRAVVTFNRGDFAQLHGEFLRRGEHHAGIIVSPQAGIGPMVKALTRIVAERQAADLHDQLVWLPT